MANRWPTKPLSDLTEKDSPITYGVVKPGEQGTVRFIRGGDIANGRILVDQLRTITEDVSSQYQRTLLRGGELLVSLVGNPGQVAIVPASLAGANIARQVGLVRLSPLVNTSFVKYFLLSPQGQRSLGTQTYGSVQQVINLRDLKTVRIPIPPLPVQYRIADILGSLDDKIELNRRMNRTLEKMAAAIFKSWFIDFDPVHAKAQGRDPNLPAEIAALFPDTFEDSDLGPIPKGWTTSTLGKECCKPQYGFTASATETPVGPRFLRITDINKRPWIEWETVPFCEVEEDSAAKYLLKPGDIVVARMADPGHATLIEEETNAVFASYLIRFRPLKTVLDRYLQYWLRSASYWDLIHGRKTGSTRATLNAKVLSELPLIRPPDDVVAAFRQQVTPLRKRVVHNVRHSASLAGLRDTLLPKLLSGEIELLEAEAAVEEVVG